jgi:uncharacterized membrane protein
MQNREILNIILTVQVLTLVTVALNIYLARQIFGFVFLSFIPGFLLLKVFKANALSLLKTALYSVGLSLAFLMFFGLLLNTLLPILGISTPLSTASIVVSVSSVTLVLSGILYRKSEPENQPEIPNPQRFKQWMPASFLLAGILILTVLGAELANFFNNTLILMVLVGVISVFVIGTFSKRFFPPKTYPLALFAVAFFLLLGTSLISNYIIGVDIQFETYFAQLTSINSIWNWTIPQAYNGMLSVTILPTIFSKFMNFDVTWIFKVAYPLIYALVPVTLFLAYRKQTNPKVAFLAVFLFMSMDTFYLQMLGLARQMIAEVFFALMILLLVEEKLSITKKRVLFMVFGVGLIVSHYSLAYLFVLYIAVTLLFSRLFRRPGDNSAAVINPVVGAGFIGVTLAWNLLVTPASFNSLVTFVTYVANQIQSLAPSPGVGGLMPTYLSPIHEVSKYLFLLLQGLIIVGFFGLLIRRKKSKFSPEYAAMCIASLSLLIVSMLVPSFATAGLNVTRFYHLALFFLAPLCITGVTFALGLAAKIKLKIFPSNVKPKRTISRNLKKTWLFLATILLVAFFLFQVGFIYEINNDVPTSISLSKNRMGNWTSYLNQLYIKPQEISASGWFLAYYNNETLVFGDAATKYLVAYGLVPYQNFYIYTGDLQDSIYAQAYFYFDALNLQQNTVEGLYNQWNMSEFSFVLNETSKIYSNGASDIYYGK